MAKTSKTSKVSSKAKSGKQSPQKKAISKKSKTVPTSPTPRKSSSASPSKASKSCKSPKYGAAFTKPIRMFKNQGDYFQLNKKYAQKGLSTRIIHCGSEPSQEFGGVSVPLDFSSTFA
mmetsp:Transcript_44530/g.59068  ORF Transcript_44530/g.59068 Transcript_44530/m.59068 type:complete len:118 (+) Transcript_44530:66-419(+)